MNPGNYELTETAESTRCVNSLDRASNNLKVSSERLLRPVIKGIAM
jgi:hypothetical protein